MSESDAVRQFTDGTDANARAIVDALVQAMGRAAQPLSVAVKWGRLTFAAQGDFHHWLCGIAITKRAVSLQFHFGGLLDDPDGHLIVGSSRFLRKIDFHTAEEVDSDAVLGFVNQALDRLEYFRDIWQAIQAEAKAE